MPKLVGEIGAGGGGGGGFERVETDPGECILRVTRPTGECSNPG